MAKRCFICMRRCSVAKKRPTCHRVSQFQCGCSVVASSWRKAHAYTRICSHIRVYVHISVGRTLKQQRRCSDAVWDTVPLERRRWLLTRVTLPLPPVPCLPSLPTEEKFTSLYISIQGLQPSSPGDALWHSPRPKTTQNRWLNNSIAQRTIRQGNTVVCLVCLSFCLIMFWVVLLSSPRFCIVVGRGGCQKVVPGSAVAFFVLFTFLFICCDFASCRASPVIAPAPEIMTSASIKRIKRIREYQIRTPIHNHGRPFWLYYVCSPECIESRVESTKSPDNFLKLPPHPPFLSRPLPPPLQLPLPPSCLALLPVSPASSPLAPPPSSSPPSLSRPPKTIQKEF